MRHVSRNTYRVTVEPNQAGKYEARIEARYAGSGWALRVYFLATNPERLAAHLQSVLRYLQRHEEELWMWGASPSDRSLLFDELLADAGLQVDHRKEFPRGAAVLTAEPGETLRSAALAELKRKLAQRLAPAARVPSRPAEVLRTSA